ncbi:unnamed protein product [Arctia plantaginis]|uniref:FHA domain-containing protein n=1 Tax=Arctia plantaginis TaxID=874455 RepID=A0A8S0YNI7_ARCPL|nr:unnamed protein product [Arctia plantaginis]CAB3256782.1 unnamed protein product [Arctia plantaginis]
MRLSSLTIGTDSGCDVRLDPAACQRVSRNHAVIFMDDVSRHFELINYSEFGSCVNGVMFACELRRPSPPSPPGAEGVGAALRDAVRRRDTQPFRISGNLTAPLAGERRCGCRVGAGAGVGAGGAGAWEGSALVPHGALLQFGCQMFVFSITDAIDPAPDLTTDAAAV